MPNTYQWISSFISCFMMDTIYFSMMGLKLIQFNNQHHHEYLGNQGRHIYNLDTRTRHNTVRMI